MLLQSFYLLYFIYKGYEHYKEKIVKIVNNLKGKDEKNDKLNQFILGSPQSCFFLFSFYYIIKIILVFINNPIFLIYANILLNIVKEASKYFVFFICIVILYQLNKMKFEDEKKSSNTQFEENSR